MAFAALIVVAALRLSPIADEAYYWTWAQALAPRYYDHPPGVALILAASTALLGDGLLGLRAPSLVSMLIVAACAVAGARRLVPESLHRDADILALLALFGAPMFVVGFIPATHDPMHGAVTAIASYLAIRALEAPASRWAFGAAFALVLAGGLKHYAAFVAVGALIGALLSRSGRRVLARPAPWLGALAAVAALSPWLAAELSADGGSLVFQAERVVWGKPSRGVVAIPMTLGSMLGTLGPLTAALLLAAIAKSRRRQPGPVLAGGAASLLLACVVAVWLGSGEANWPMPALIFALPLVVAEVVERPRLRLAMQATAVLSMVLMGLALIHAASPVLPVPARRDPTARGAGFENLAARVASVAESHGAAVVATRRYQVASLLRYHLRDRWPVLEIGTPSGRMSQYDRWPRRWPCPGEVFVEVAPGRGRLAVAPGLELAAPEVFARGRHGDPIDTFTITPVQASTTAGDRCAGPR